MLVAIMLTADKQNHENCKETPTDLYTILLFYYKGLLTIDFQVRIQ